LFKVDDRSKIWCRKGGEEKRTSQERYLRKRKQNSHLPPSGVPKQQPTPTAQPTVRTSV